MMSPPRTAILACITLATILPSFRSSAQSQEAFSRRVGPVLDAVERDYFGLFPQIAAFEEARLEGLHGDRVEVRVSRLGGSDTMLLVPSNAMTAIGRYIDDYERVILDLEDPELAAVAGWVRPRVMPAVPDHLDVQTRSGEVFTGTVIAVSDSAVALWQAPGPYQWDHLEHDLHIIHYSAIERVRHIRNKVFAVLGVVVVGGMVAWGEYGADHRTLDAVIYGGAVAGSGLGLTTVLDIDDRVGGNAVMFSRLRFALQGMAMFDTARPPELSTAMRTAESSAAYRSAEQAVTLQELRDDETLNPIRIIVDKLWWRTLAGNHVTVEDHFLPNIPSTETDVRVASYSMSVGLEVAASRRLLIGVNFSPYIPLDTQRSFVDDYIYGNAYGLTGGFVALEATRTLRQPFEIVVNGGVTLHDMSWIGTQTKITRTSRRDTLYTGSSARYGASVGIRAGFRPSPGFAAHAEFTDYWLPAMTLGAPETLFVPNEHVRPHDINLSGVAIRFGLELRL